MPLFTSVVRFKMDAFRGISCAMPVNIAANLNDGRMNESDGLHNVFCNYFCGDSTDVDDEADPKEIESTSNDSKEGRLSVC